MRRQLNLTLSAILVLVLACSVTGQDLKKDHGNWVVEDSQILKTDAKGELKIVDIEGDVDVQDKPGNKYLGDVHEPESGFDPDPIAAAFKCQYHGNR